VIANAKDQLDEDSSLTKLVNVMEDVYSFVDAIREFPKKILLEGVIMMILKQTFECCIYIREFGGRRFSRMVIVCFCIHL
jgi:hypothetical protein